MLAQGLEADAQGPVDTEARGLIAAGQGAQRDAVRATGGQDTDIGLAGRPSSAATAPERHQPER
eukprot:8819324-Alexandrium_andersonii.AAC.1